MIILGIGSNLSSSFGDRFKNINLAIENLESNNIKIIKRSSFYETPSYPDKQKPKFINVVIEVETTLNSSEIASVLISVEKKLERKRNLKNEPRTCDIDIIDYNGQNFNFNYKKFNFIVPHNKLEFRNFVLVPLNEILPNWIHPKTKEHIGSLLKKLNDVDKNSILKIKKS